VRYARAQMAAPAPARPEAPPPKTPSRAPARARVRRWPACALAIALALTYRAIWHGQAVIGRDVFRIFIPNASFLLECLRAHVLPLWIPYERLGQPFAGSLQAFAFYPPAWLAVLTVGPVWTPTALQLFNAVVLASGMFLAARALGRSGLGSAIAAAVAALSPMFFQLSYLPNLSGALAWGGFVVLGASRLSRKPGLASAAWLAWPLALSAMCGAPEVTACEAVIALVIAGRNRRALAFTLLGCAWAVVLGAITLVPALEFARHSTRALHPDLTWSTAPGQLVSAFLPFADAPHLGYVGPDQSLVPSLFLGTTTLVLAIAGARRRRGLALLAVALAVLALGRYVPGTRWLLAHPPLALFRFPVKYFLGAALCLALLAAEGLDRVGALARKLAASGARFAQVSAVAIAGFLVGVPLVQRPFFRAGLQVGFLWALGCAWGIAAIFWLVRVRERARRVRLGIAAVLVLELAFFAWRSPPVGFGAPAGFTQASSLAAKIPPGARLSGVVPARTRSEADETYFLAHARDGLVPMQAVVERIASVEGADSPDPERIEPLVNAPSVPRAVYDLLGVSEFVRERAPFADTQEVATVPGVSSLYRSTTAMPRAFVVYRGEPVSDAVARERISDAAEPFRAIAFLAESNGFATARDCLPFTPAELSESLDALRVTFDACDLGELVVTDAAYPGWRATLDGQPVAIERVDLVARGVRVPAGRHTLEMRYRPASFRLGALLTLLGALGLALTFRTRRA
jgi:hypothetical protein